MFKKSGSRNQRSKGIRMKHVLQISLLLGVCFWLIYQVKRSHDKRKEFDEKDAKASVKAEIDDVIIKFGRKDLPHVQEVSTNHKHEEEENGVEVEEENKHDEEQDGKAKRVEEGEQEGISKHEDEEQEEGNKHEEDEQEEASKHEEEERDEASKHEEEEEEQEEVREDEGSKHDDDEEQEAEIKDEEAEDGGRGGGDDEVDGNELERADGEAVHEEEFMDEEKEREAEGDDKENEEKENEEKEREGEEESNNSENEQNHDEGDRNVHEAREEHYKADDASSAVSHVTQMINSEDDKLHVENSGDNSMMNVLEQETKANTTEETNGGENKSELKVSESGSSLNATYAKENDHETGSSNSEYISLPNTTHTTEFVDQTSNDSAEVSKETGNKPGEVNNTEMPGSLQNGTSAQHTTEDSKVTEETYQEKANETISYPDSNTANSSKIENVDLATRDSSNSSTNAESGMSEDIAKINATAGGDGFGSSETKEITDSTQNDKSEGDNESNGTDESTDASSNETVDGAQQDPIDTSDNTLPQEEKDARVDLRTLPDITTEGSNHEDAAAE
ncbi:hypothetical protein PTKIN_Ptkin02bG0236600 [Pterospermum kingtungense]